MGWKGKDMDKAMKRTGFACKLPLVLADGTEVEAIVVARVYRDEHGIACASVADHVRTNFGLLHIAHLCMRNSNVEIEKARADLARRVMEQWTKEESCTD